MNGLLRVFSDARGHREDAERARKLAETASGQLQSELLELAAQYDLLADGIDPDEDGRRTRFTLTTPARREIATYAMTESPIASRPLAEEAISIPQRSSRGPDASR